MHVRIRSVQLAAAVPVWLLHKRRHTGVTMLADGGAPITPADRDAALAD